VSVYELFERPSYYFVGWQTAA